MLRSKHSVRGAIIVLAVVFTLSIALTATNVVPASRAGSTNAGAPTANQLKPPACAALNLSTVVVGGGAVPGTGSADLIIGSAGNDTLSGRGGADCIVGGDGNDSLRGDGGTDVCIGGAGLDTFHVTCETQIQ